jgi:hypothetical protein
MEKLRVLCIGDNHFKTSNVKEMTEMCDKIYEYIENNIDNIDLIVNLGDTLHTHSLINIIPLTQAIKFLIKLSQYKKTFLLIGNHDRINNSDYLSDYHAFTGLKINNLTIVNKVLIENINGFKFVFVPYVFPGRFQEALNTKKDEIGDLNTVKCFFAHQELYGVEMGSIVSMIGDKWDKNNPFIISGHIHQYTRPQKNIIYTGTPCQETFGERDDKTISLFTFNKDTNEPEEKRIDLGLIKKVICRIKCSDVVKWIPPEKCLIKLIIEGNSSEIKAIIKLDYVKKLAKSGIKIVYNTIDEINQNVNKSIKREELKLPYAQRLLNHVKLNEGQFYWYNLLFNKMD